MRSPFEINDSASSVIFKTNSCFQKPSKTKEKISPIDLYWENIQLMNKLINDISRNQVLGLLILLGSVSAVESYFRTLFCNIITIDKNSEKKCLQHTLAYGAVISSIKHSKTKEDIAEALLEGYSFANKKNIVEALKNFIGIQGHLPDELSLTLDAFEKVCHLRHCAVHRFGILGTNNAISLDFDTHSIEIGNSLLIGENEIDKIVGICTNLVKVINNFLFDFLIKRILKTKTIIWKWDFRSDKKLFIRYHQLFYSKQFSKSEKYSLKKIYLKYKNENQNA